MLWKQKLILYNEFMTAAWYEVSYPRINILARTELTKSFNTTQRHILIISYGYRYGVLLTVQITLCVMNKRIKNNYVQRSIFCLNLNMIQNNVFVAFVNTQ